MCVLIIYRRYRSKDFSKTAIRKVLSQDPFWLTFPVEEIDARLGYFQKTFSLAGNEVRQLAGMKADLITWPGIPGQIRYNIFTLREMCGFSQEELKQILMTAPEVFKKRREQTLQNTFNFLHNDIGFSHQLLVKFASCLDVEVDPIKPRLEYLKKLGRAQFDPSKPNYVSPESIAQLSDLEFCEKVAKSSVHLYNDFLMTI